VGEVDGTKLASWIDAGETVEVRYSARTQLKPNCVTQIVRGAISGERFPDEVVILGAHHDSVGAVGMPAAMNSPGACDDASGVAILLEMARAYARKRPERTLWFCSFGGEERHQVGSSAYVRILNESKALNRVIAYLGVDQAARGDTLRLLASGSEPHLLPEIDLRGILGSAAEDLDLTREFDTFGPAPVHAASDHWPFFYAGIPAFLTGWHPFDDWHRSSDDFDSCVEDDEFLATAELMDEMVRRVCALPEVGLVERSPAAGYVLQPPSQHQRQ
jgi:aminopeptidase YwaD